MQRVEPISKPTQKVVKLFRDFWLYCIIMGFSEAEMGRYTLGYQLTYMSYWFVTGGAMYVQLSTCGSKLS